MMNLEQIFEEFLLDCKIKGLKPSTIRSYQYEWKFFTREMHIDTLNQVNKQTIKQYTVFLQSREAIQSPHAINNHLRSLRAILYWMMDDEQGFIQPFAVKMLKADFTVKDIYSSKEILRLLRKPKSTDSFTTWRSWMVANMLYYTGMRSATMLEVRWSDVDFPLMTMDLLRTKRGQRTIPMDLELAKALKIYTRQFPPINESCYIFNTTKGKKMASRTLQQTMKAYHQHRLVKTHLLHQYRRTFITEKLVAGAEPLKVARMVGHQDLSMINKHYLPHTVELLRDLVK